MCSEDVLIRFSWVKVVNFCCTAILHKYSSLHCEAAGSAESYYSLDVPLRLCSQYVAKITAWMF